MKIINLLDVNKQFGARVRFLRNEKKVSIQEFALQIEINPNYLSDLERGNRNPTLKVMSKIAKGFEMSLSELLEGVSGEF